MELIEDRLRAEYRQLTHGQKQIADYLLAHSADVHFVSSRQLADLVGVSESAIVRFAQRIGFAGYPEMRRAIRDQYRARAGHQDLLISGIRRDLSESNIISDTIWRDIELLTHLGNLLDPAVLEDSARRISSAHSVVAIGHRTSYSFAEFFANSLRQGIGKGTPLTYGSGMVYDTLTSMDPDTVLVVVTLSPHAEQTIDMLKVASKRGMHCIAITDSANGEAAQIANATLLVDTDFQVFTSSYISVLATIHVLLAMIGHYSAEQAEEFLKRIEAQDRELGRG